MEYFGVFVVLVIALGSYLIYKRRSGGGGGSTRGGDRRSQK